MRATKKKPTPSLQKDIIGDLIYAIRFPLMEMADIVQKVSPTGLLSSEDTLAIFTLLGNQGKGKSKFSAVSRKGGKKFVYVSDFDQKGIIYYLGTRKGKSPWMNPHDGGIVQVTSSSLENGSLNSLVGNAPPSGGYLYTNSTANSWFMLDLKENKAKVSHYTIRHGYNGGSYFPRNWQFQGSENGSSWVTLKNHVNDSSISTSMGSKTFAVEHKNPPFFRYFRIYGSGTNSSGDNYLMVSGLEMYGQLKA